MSLNIERLFSSIGTCPATALATADLPIDEKMKLPLCVLSACGRPGFSKNDDCPKIPMISSELVTISTYLGQQCSCVKPELSPPVIPAKPVPKGGSRGEGIHAVLRRLDARLRGHDRMKHVVKTRKKDQLRREPVSMLLPEKHVLGLCNVRIDAGKVSSPIQYGSRCRLSRCKRYRQFRT
jgi:hypothetical protein